MSDEINRKAIRQKLIDADKELNVAAQQYPRRIDELVNEVVSKAPSTFNQSPFAQFAIARADEKSLKAFIYGQTIVLEFRWGYRDNIFIVGDFLKLDNLWNETRGQVVESRVLLTRKVFLDERLLVYHDRALTQVDGNIGNPTGSIIEAFVEAAVEGKGL